MNARTNWDPVPPGCRQRSGLLRALRRHALEAPMGPSQSLAISYPEFLTFFAKAKTITRHHLVVGASFSYAWMPTILDFRSTALDQGVAALTKARKTGAISDEDALCLAQIVNNSVVGTSKLLHFVAPDAFAIWDSRVASYLGTRVEGGRRGVAQYQRYNQCVLAMSTTRDAKAIARTVSRRTTVATEPVRALELVMYSAGVGQLTYDA